MRARAELEQKKVKPSVGAFGANGSTAEWRLLINMLVNSCRDV